MNKKEQENKMSLEDSFDFKLNEIIKSFIRVILLEKSKIFDFSTTNADLDNVHHRLKNLVTSNSKVVNWSDQMASSNSLILMVNVKGDILQNSHSFSNLGLDDLNIVDSIISFENWTNAKNEITRTGYSIPFDLKSTFFILAFKDQASQNIMLLLQKKIWFKPVEKTGIELVVNSEDRERRRLAVDLHDSLGQHLTGIRFLLDSIDCKEDLANEILGKAKVAIDSSIEELRNISYNLIPKPLDQEPLEIVLGDFFQRINSMFGVSVDFIFSDLRNITLMKSFEVSLFRIIQEIVSNSVKHGKSSILNVHFSVNKESLELVIKDNGHGFEYKKLDAKGHGLRNIENRVVKYDGQMKRESSKGKGTKYQLNFPLNTVEII